MKLLSSLLRFLLLRVVDDSSGDPPASGSGDDPGIGDDPPGSDDDLGDDLGDLDDDPGTPPVSGSRASGRSAPRDDTNERIARLEAELAAARRAPPAPTTPHVDPEYQREEERLRASDITDLERWQIQSNRTLRETRQQAAQAVAHAQDVADRTAFQAKFSSDPRRAKYADRVEQTLADMRQRGQAVPREVLYFTMLGKDVAEGKLKPKTKQAPPADLPRGRTPNARSDVSGRGKGMTDREKLRARLENVNI